MTRASSVAVLTVLTLTAVAAADEYTVQPMTGLYVAPPALPILGELNPQSVQVVIAKNLDAQTVQVDLPFEFPYFGRIYTQISVADDGWLAFGSIDAVQSANPALPATTTPNAVVAALWDRLATRGKGQVVTFLKSGATAAPNRVFVVAWDHVNLSDAKAADDLSFEVHLHEGTGVVEIAYSPAGVWNNLSYTAGIENETGTRGFGGPFTTNTNSGRPTTDQRFTPNVVQVTGRILRDRPVATETGLGPAIETELPVAGADVALVREDGNEIIARARTTAAGTFTLTSRGLDGSPTFAIDLLCSGAESRVTDFNGLTWRRRIATGIAPVGAPVVPDVHLDAGVDVFDPNFRKALNVQQAAYKGYAWAQAAFDASGKDQIAVRKRVPQLEIRWVQGSAAVTGYAPATSTTAAQAIVSDDPKNPDAYDDDVILREYSQHLLATIAPFAGRLTTHVWAPPPHVPPAPEPTPASPIASFLDGFSFWFAAAVQERARFIDTRFDDASLPTATVFDLEVPSPAATGSQVAGSIAATLWELVDPANDALDEFAGSLPATGRAVFTTLDERTATSTTATVPAGAPAPTIGSFFERWRPTRTEGEAVATSRTFIAHKALADDPKEPNDRAGEAQQFVLEAQKTIDLVLNQSNTDRFTFTLGDAPLSLAVSYSEATQAEVTIRDAADAPVPLALTPATTSPIVVTTVEDQTPGTYVVQIVWKSGPAARYSLVTFTPPSLATPLPSKWTVGLPFNQTLTLTGGLQPATFQLASGAVPGLSVQSGARYVGTPTKTGTYPLTFTVTDATGAGPQTLSPFTIQIFEALTLPSVFGVAADKPVSVDVGRGGVAAVWTKGPADPNQPPPPGFEVTDGPTLHLAGPAIGPRAFRVSASATDPAPLNASLSTRSSQIVVCAPIAAAARSTPAAAAPFGYWFDAIAGSRAALALRFSGPNAPVFQTLVDDRGTAVELGDRVLVQGPAGIRIVNLVVPRTARYFLVFGAKPEFAGTVAAARLALRPPTRASGVVNIATTSTRVSARFTAIGGSKATVVLRSGPVPKPAKPGILEIRGPDGVLVELPSARIGPGGARETWVGVVLPLDGEYVMTIGGDGETTGPIVFDVVIRAPRNAVFSLD